MRNEWDAPSTQLYDLNRRSLHKGHPAALPIILMLYNPYIALEYSSFHFLFHYPHIPHYVPYNPYITLYNPCSSNFLFHYPHIAPAWGPEVLTNPVQVAFSKGTNIFALGTVAARALGLWNELARAAPKLLGWVGPWDI